MLPKKVLVPVDFSEDSINALTYAVEFTQPFRSEIVVLYVLEPIYYASPADMYATSPNLTLLIDEQRQAGREQLARIESGLLKRRRKVRALMRTGAPATAIIDTAKKEKADLIVMGTHGRTGFAHMMIGSIAEKVVRTASCPVLTLRPGSVKTTKPKRKR